LAGRPTSRRRRVATLVLLAVVGGLATVAVAGTVGAAPTSRRVSGTWDLTVADPSPGCTQNCILVTFRGGISGNGEAVAVGPPAPAHPPSNLMAPGDATVHTRRGDLFLSGTSVFNPTGEGEFTFLFRITGGTGAMAGASGWVGSVGVSDVPATQFTNERYEGRLVLP
jgi:hypothetical protein